MNIKLLSVLAFTLTINQIIGQEIAPFTINCNIATYSNHRVELDLNTLSVDVNEDNLTFSLLDNNQINGVVGVDANTGILTYTSDQEFSGDVSIQFVANDGINNSDP